MGSERSGLGRPRLWFLAMCVAACALGAAPGALAAPTTAERQAARGLMDKGDELFEAQKYAEALKAYQAAHAIMNVPSTALALAQCHEKLRQWTQALEVAREVGRMPVRADESAVLKQSRKDASDLVASLEARIPSVSIVVTGAARAEVRIDGLVITAESLGKPISLNPGRHVAAAIAEGTPGATQEFTLAEGAAITVDLRIPAYGVGAGTPGQDNPPAPAPAAEQRSAPLWLWLSLGIGAAGIGVGAVTGVLSLNKASAAKELCAGNACPEAARGDADDAKMLANVSNVGFAVGVVGIGAGVLGLVLRGDKDPGPARSGQLQPWVSPGSAGISGWF
jgi:tetratricopeptide (TPR) repeat protein